MRGPYIELELPPEEVPAGMSGIPEAHTTQALVARLDAVERQALRPADQQKAPICSIIGPPGSGKSALVSHWAQTRRDREGCSPHILPLYITMGEQQGSLPLFYSLYRNIWHTLLRMAGTAYKIKDSRGKERYASFSYRNAEYLRGNILEMLERMPINPIIIDKAHRLDRQAIEEAVSFRMYDHESYGQKPRRAMLLIATEEESKKLQLTEHLMQIGEARAAWSERIQMPLLNEVEFSQIFFKLVLVNLNAEFSPRLNLDKVPVEVYQLTKGDWWNISIYADELDNELSFSAGRRVVTREILDRVKRRLTTQRLRA